jgi:hypothetical protein
MPRKSAEAVAGAWARQHLNPGGRPKAPKHLPRDAARLFDEIVGSRAPDLFMPGSLHLLEQFCMIAVTLTKLWQRLDELPIDSKEAAKLQRIICTLGALQCRLAECCALLPRHTHGRRSGVLSERHSPGLKPWDTAPGKVLPF